MISAAVSFQQRFSVDRAQQFENDYVDGEHFISRFQFIRLSADVARVVLLSKLMCIGFALRLVSNQLV